MNTEKRLNLGALAHRCPFWGSHCLNKLMSMKRTLRGPSFLIDCFGVSEPPEEGAWLEAADGKCYPIKGSCSLGRAAVNTIMLDSPKVSRRHALIHLQNIGELWLIDFGSSNGTFLNKRRIHQPIRLSDGDQITIGDQLFKLRQSLPVSEEYKTPVLQRTLREIENVPCWLLVADIRGFTPLSRQMQSEDLDVLVGAWIFSSKQIIENQHGIINKYLGDGFLAYWPEVGTSPEEIVAVLSALKELQRKESPAFRFIVHFGLVAIGGVASMGEESLIGGEVNLIFRLEKLASSLGEPCCVSETANAKLGGLVATRSLGEFELKGFEGKCAFYAL
jgi:adenylate cyclase